MFKKQLILTVALMFCLSFSLTAFAAPDQLAYNKTNLSIIFITTNGATSYTVRDGGHWIVNFPSFNDALAAMNYMKNYNTISFEGRGTANIKSWFENTALVPSVFQPKSSNDTLSYNPQNLSIILLQSQGKTSYTVRDGSHYIVNFPTFKDAQEAMIYMKNFNTIAFTGRGTNNINTWFENH